MNTLWEEGRGAPLNINPLGSNPYTPGVYAKPSPNYQTLSAQDAQDEEARQRELREGLEAAQASAWVRKDMLAAEAKAKAKEQDSQEQDSRERAKQEAQANHNAIESAEMGGIKAFARRYLPNTKMKVGVDGAFDDIDMDPPSHIEAHRNGDGTEVIEAHRLQRKPFLKPLRDFELWLAFKMGIETGGVDRIHEMNKLPPWIGNIYLIWITITCHAGTIPIGILGAELGLSFHQSIAAIVAGCMLGALCAAFCGTLGPKTGLRAIATSRYSFGFWGAKLASILSILVGSGFGVVNMVVAGQILSAVSNYHITITAGCIIVAVVSYIIALFGFKVIHTFEKYGWIPTFIIMIVLMSQASPRVHVAIPARLSGLGLTGSFLTFLGINFSSTSGWCSSASDYYVNYKRSIKPWKVFWLTFFGICIPTIFATVLGAMLGNIAVASTSLTSNPNAHFVEVYKQHGFGSLLLNMYHPFGFSKFALVVLTLSVLGNNVAINYSAGLDVQLLGHYFHAIPRFMCSFAVSATIAVLAIAGGQHVSVVIMNFVSMLGYWTISFTVILLMEYKLIRLPNGYTLHEWDTPAKLPLGVAAVLALLAGYLAGGVPGMAKPWYIGPIAAKFGPAGGDVGIWMSGAITAVFYFPARYYEIQWTGR